MAIVIQIGNASSNAGYVPLGAVFKAKLTRISFSQPSVLTLTAGADPVLDSGIEKRFYPFLNIQVLEVDLGDGTYANRKYFDGRIDQAELVQDEQYGRVWQISARDWLAVLADNFVDKGEWLSAQDFTRGVHKSTGDTWVANYVGDYTGENPGHPGEYRRFMIQDLALNVIHSQTVGIQFVLIQGAPNSKRIEWNADNNAMVNILDAIRQLAAADPWNGGAAGASEVDGKDISDAGFPAGSGFGGELQQKCDNTGDDPQTLQYFKRGAFDSHCVWSYDISDAPGITGWIIEKHFNEEGTDIFSRTRIVGKGEGQYNVNTSGNASEGGGEGVVVPAMEESWNPQAGLFRVRRENPNPRSESLVGEYGYEDQSDEKQAIRARALRDQAYANLISGSAGLSNLRGGHNQGAIVVSGLPNTPEGGVVLPGTIAKIAIQDLGFDGQSDASTFVVQSWSYDFPMMQTTYTLARQGFSDAGTQLLTSLTSRQDSQSAHNDYYDTGWQKSDAGGTIVVKHSLGVKPSKITIEASTWDGSTLDQNRAPLPTFQTTVTVPATGWDAAQGQNHGFFVSRSDAETVSIKFAHWLAYSDGAGEWLKHDDPNTLVRVRVAP